MSGRPMDPGILFMYLTHGELKGLRLLSRSYSLNVANYKRFRDSCVFHLDGRTCAMSTPDLRKEAIGTLLRSQCSWASLQLTCLDLDSGLFGQEALFDRFVSVQGPGLISLSLVSCQVGLGRLVELLTFCPKLEGLVIRNCPVLMAVGQDILNWRKFIPHFYYRLSGLKHFVMEDSREDEPSGHFSHDFSAWFSGMTRLTRLELVNSKGSLPAFQFPSFLNLCRDSLRHLSLIGKFDLSGPLIGSLRSLDLLTLTLGKARMADPLNFGLFLSRQTNLTFLGLSSIVLKHHSFHGISDLKHLARLQLDECLVDERTNQCLSALSRTECIRRIDLTQNIYNDLGIHWGPLFSSGGKRSLKELHVTVRHVGFFIQDIGKCCGGLEVLSIYGAMKSFGNPLQLSWIWRLEALKSLKLGYCQLKDADFVPEYMDLNTRTLSDLQNLEQLDLSLNAIGNETILTQVILLPKLKELHIEGTQVTTDCLYEIRNARLGPDHRLPDLRLIQAEHCLEICLSRTAAARLGFCMYPVRVLHDYIGLMSLTPD